MTRSPFVRFADETPPAIGHNNGPPLDPGVSWRRHVWTKARRDLMPRLPLEVVRRRVARAKELGLAYPQYASILTGTGRDVVAFLFTSDALMIRVARGLPPDRAERLGALIKADRLLLSRAVEDPERLVDTVREGSNISFKAAGRGPDEPATWGQGRRALIDILRPLRLNPDAVVMVGARPAERDWSNAAGLAKFLPDSAYFGPVPGS